MYIQLVAYVNLTVMAIAHAILAVLVNQPCSGYDLAKQFDSSVGYFWQASHQQIYRELGKLEAQGWIEAEIIPQEGRPDKKLYSVTEFGQQQLVQWLTQPCDPAVIKDELLVKVFAGDLIAPAVLIAELKRHRHIHQEKLSVYQAIAQEHFRQPENLPLEAKLQYLTLRRGIRYETDCISWCEEAIEQLQQLDPRL